MVVTRKEGECTLAPGAASLEEQRAARGKIVHRIQSSYSFFFLHSRAISLYTKSPPRFLPTDLIAMGI